MKLEYSKREMRLLLGIVIMGYSTQSLLYKQLTKLESVV